MKPGTSFFNPSLLRRDLVRFAPAWVLYSLFLVLEYSGSILGFSRADVANTLAASVGVFGVYNLFYAMLCAQLLFGDLFSSRMCNALHALPIRREGWFLTHVLSGLAFCVIPVAAEGLVLLTVLGTYWPAALLWMAALVLQFVFFYGVAVLSVMLVGSRFAAVVVYAILSFLSAIVLWLFYALYQPHLYGFVMDETPFLILCPAVYLFRYDWFRVLTQTGRVMPGGGWGYLGICAAVGVLLLGAALLLYRKRALEKAGDFIVFSGTAPVFLILYTFSAGAALHLFSNLFVGESTEFVFLIVGLAVGFFTGLMLLKRTLRVFRGKVFAQFAALLCAFGLTLLLTVLDPLGVTRWVPKASEVKWVALNCYGAEDMQDHAITDKNVIRQVLAIHQHAVEHPEEGSNGKQDTQVSLAYKLDNGTVVQREYFVDRGTLTAITLEHVLSRPETVFGKAYTTLEALQKQTHYIEVDIKGTGSEIVTDPEQIRSLLQALLADAQAGNLCQDYWLREDNGENFYLYIRQKSRETAFGYYTGDTWSITYTEQSTHTLAWMEENLK